MLSGKQGRGAIILAGGASRRFPGGKLSARLHGKPLLLHAVETAMQVAAAVYVIGDQQVVKERESVFCLPDEDPGSGPLAALATGLKAGTKEWNILMAGDMPSVSATDLRQLLQAEVTTETLICFQHHGRIQPMPSLIHRSALQTIDSLLKEGKRSLLALFHTLRPGAIEPARPDHLHDIDTPEDLDRISH